MTIPANKLDLILDQGDTFQCQFQVKDHGESPAVPFSLTSASLWFTAKSDLDDADDSAVFQKDENDGITVDDAANGKFTVTIAPADTASMTGFRYGEKKLFYDIQVKDSANNIFTVARGNLTVIRHVTISTS